MRDLPLHLHRYDGDPEPLPLVLLHGLFGSGGNWHPIARRLAGVRRVLAADLRNHGSSPHTPDMDYPAIAADLVALLDAEGIDRALLVGHSMGGKAAMWLALAAPERVAALAVVDIAPVRYAPGFEALVEALRSLPLADLQRRGDADALLAPLIPDPRVRGFLLLNLRHDDAGWRWRCNLSAIHAALPELLDFRAAAGRQFTGQVQFIYGSESSYLTADALPAIRALFPLARLRPVANAGHWVHADQPEAFVTALAPLLRVS
jgi:esterase